MRQIVVGMGMALLLSACGDPLQSIARLSDVTVADGVRNLAQTSDEAQSTNVGLFVGLLDNQLNYSNNSDVAAAIAEAGEVTSVAEDLMVVSAVTPGTWALRSGLFSLFGGNTNRGPLSRVGSDGTDITAGAMLKFGEVARVCGLHINDFGRQIDSGGGFRIFDTTPNSTAPRPFYISGFDDNCARKFTGAVVVSGDVETHEFVRYQISNKRIDYTTTDNAYEALKASVCRVGRGQPCGTRTESMNSNTYFITVYSFFGGTYSAVPSKWAQILVHDGEVLAISIKDGEY
jgi:hypothetical protein